MHQTIEAEQERWSSIAQLAAEYETIAAAAQRDRWVGLVKNCGLTVEEVDRVLGSESFGPLTAELRRAEAIHHDVDRLLLKVVARRPLGDADDVGVVLISRLQHVTSRPERGRKRVEPRLIAGLIPAAGGPMSEEMAVALRERQDLIQTRAAALVFAAAEHGEPWLSRIGERPVEMRAREAWLAEVRTVAAYRDRYGIDARTALGGEARTDAQKLDHARARQAIRSAQVIAQHLRDHPMRSLAVSADVTPIEWCRDA